MKSIKSIWEEATRRMGSALGLHSVAVELTADELTDILHALWTFGDGDGLDSLRRKLLGCLELLGGDTRGFDCGLEKDGTR